MQLFVSIPLVQLAATLLTGIKPRTTIRRKLAQFSRYLAFLHLTFADSLEYFYFSG